MKITNIDEMPGKIEIAWKEELKPLEYPRVTAGFTINEVFDFIYFCSKRCDALLKRLEEHEKVMLDLMKVR